MTYQCHAEHKCKAKESGKDKKGCQSNSLVAGFWRWSVICKRSCPTNPDIADLWNRTDGWFAASVCPSKIYGTKIKTNRNLVSYLLFYNSLINLRTSIAHSI